MGWFAQTAYPYEKQGINGRYTIAEIGCFVTAFCNLLQRFGKNIDPPSLNRLFIQRGIYIDVDDGIRDDLGWPSITSYDGQVVVREVGGAGWPPNNNAIVKFYYKSQRTGAMVTHFCLVADVNAGTIIDSWDGQIKRPGIYGTPVAWCTYDNVVPQPVEPRITPTPQPAPTPSPTQDGPSIRYEVLNNPRKMHVRNAKGDGSGANKYAFGSAKSWTDFSVVDHKAENFNVTIVAIAHHPIPPKGADYYMDAVALGDYLNNGGRVANTIGFSWADLADGWIEEEQKPAPAAPTPVVPSPTPVQPTPVNTVPTIPEVTPVKPAPTLTPPVAQAPKPNPNAWRSSFKSMKRELYVVRNDSVVQDFGGIRPNKIIRSNTSIEIAGTFIYRDTLYGRPSQSVDNGNWYGIHMTNLISEDELFSLRTDLATKVGAGASLNLAETLTLNISRLKKSWAKFNDRNKK